MSSERAARVTSIVLVLAGLAAVFLAWNGAAEHDHVAAQLPYLISGGLTGVILAGAGLVLLRNFEARRDSRRIEARLDAMREAIDRLAAEQPTYRLTHRETMASAGESDPPWAPPLTDPAPLATEHEPMIAGPTTYHRQDCRLVANRQAPKISRAAARQRNLAPCRVCQPDNPTAGPPVADTEHESAAPSADP